MLIQLVVLVAFLYLFFKSGVFRTAVISYELFVIVLVLLVIAGLIAMRYKKIQTKPEKYIVPNHYMVPYPRVAGGEVDYRTKQIRQLADANGCEFQEPCLWDTARWITLSDGTEGVCTLNGKACPAFSKDQTKSILYRYGD